jgi:hypothetical protein
MPPLPLPPPLLLHCHTARGRGGRERACSFRTRRIGRAPDRYHHHGPRSRHRQERRRQDGAVALLPQSKTTTTRTTTTTTRGGLGGSRDRSVPSFSEPFGNGAIPERPAPEPCSKPRLIFTTPLMGRAFHHPPFRHVRSSSRPRHHHHHHHHHRQQQPRHRRRRPSMRTDSRRHVTHAETDAADVSFRGGNPAASSSSETLRGGVTSTSLRSAPSST